MSPTTLADNVDVLTISIEGAFVDELRTQLRPELSVAGVETIEDAWMHLDTADEVECVVTAFNLPTTDALEFLDRFRDHYPHLPILFMSSNVADDTVTEAVASGATDFFHQPSGRSQPILVANRVHQAIDNFRHKPRPEDSTSDSHHRSEVANSTEVGAFVYDVRSEEFDWSEEVYQIHNCQAEFDPTLERVAALYDDKDRTKVRDAFEQVTQTGLPFSLETRLLTSEDNPSKVRLRGHPVIEGGSVNQVFGTAQCITKTDSEAEEQFKALSKASRELMQAKTREQVAEIITDAAENILGYIRAAVRLVDEEQAVLETVATTERNVVAAGQRPDYHVTEDVPASRTYRQSEPEIYDDLSITDDEYDRGELRSGLYIPIEDHGVFSCGAIVPGAFDRRDINLVTLLTKLSKAALDRIHFEERLQAEKQHYESLFTRASEHAGHAIYITAPDGTIEYVNPAFEEMTGYTSEEAVGETPHILASGEMSERYYERLWETISNGDVWAEEITNRRKNGELYYANQTVAPIFDDDEIEGFIAIQTDITDRKEHEQQLKRQQEETERLQNLLKQALTATDTYVWEWYPKTGEVSVYPSVESLFELSPTEDSVNTVDEFLKHVHPEDQEDLEQQIQKGIETDSGFRTEFRFNAPDGSWVWIRSQAKVKTASDEDQMHVLGSATDITTYKNRERQIQVLDRLLRHNLRNEMNVIWNRAELIRAQSEAESVTTQADQIIEKSEELLSMAAKERQISTEIQDNISKKPLELGAILDGLITRFQERYPNATITLEGPDSVTVSAVPKITTAIEELLENALEHADREQPTVAVTISSHADRVEIEVADSGPGLSEQEQRILTEVPDIDQLYHSSGLGLWQIYLFVRQSDGTIQYAENEPRGSVVRIELEQPPELNSSAVNP